MQLRVQLLFDDGRIVTEDCFSLHGLQAIKTIPETVVEGPFRISGYTIRPHYIDLDGPVFSWTPSSGSPSPHW